MFSRCAAQFVSVWLATIAAFLPTAAAEDFSKRYPATRSWSQQGLAAIATADDVWQLSRFDIALDDQLHLRGERATVVFGTNDTDVLWAVVLPEQPMHISGTQAIEGELAANIVLRFAPAQVASVFPAETVIGRGLSLLRFQAQRIAANKMVWRWCTPAGNPTIVPEPITLVDVDTVQGTRRLWMIDRNAQQVLRVDDFADQPTPALQPVQPEAALRCFDELCSAFDRGYAKFIDLPDVNWHALAEQYREQAARAETSFMLAAVITDMLSHLKDLHIWVRQGETWLSTYHRDRPLNANRNATLNHLTEPHEAGSNLTWGRTHDDIGYLGINALSDPELVTHVDAALEQLRDTKAMIIDLRFNGGGDELLAQAIAGRFAAEPVVYSRNQYRNGPAHTDLGPMLERSVQPRGPWRYEQPVVCIFGRKTLSSAESLAAMFVQMPHVMTIGSPTGGSSANPRQLHLDCGIAVNLPRWRDLLVSGEPIEGRGVQPQVRMEHSPHFFNEGRDPVFEAALATARRMGREKRDIAE